MDALKSLISWIGLYSAIAFPVGLCFAHTVPTIDPSQNLPAFVVSMYIILSAAQITDKYIKLKLWRGRNAA
jgi:hypothetical protein